jgi:hypothetical protein
MKIQCISGFLLTLCLSVPAAATDYIYRDLMANTLPSAQCEVTAKAMQTASKQYNLDRYSKKFCQSQGYGWHLETIKDSGKTQCNECSNPQGLQKCHQEDVLVVCKRIKPGTVGMLPGKG